MQITIFGAGYVGLVTGTCLAELGHHVTVIEINPGKLTQLQQGIVPIYEPGLTELLQANLQAGRLAFSADAKAGIQQSDYLFIAVGTPADDQGAADLRQVFTVAKAIGQHLAKPSIIVNKSTVPVGTATKVQAIIQTELQARELSLHFTVVSNPEFLKEGCAIQDFMQPDRIIVGADDQDALQRLRELYAPLLAAAEHRFISMDTRSAELTKYAANAFLATKISFMNEMSQLAERVGADIEHVRQGIGSDARIGPHFLFAGCGYGGSCFPKDVSALRHLAHEQQCELTMLGAVEQVNAKQKQILHEKIACYFKQQLQDKVIALWGLAFKPNTDDMREASSRVLMEALWQSGARVQAYDPVAHHEARRLYGERADLKLCQTAHEALQGADALAIVTEWQEFHQPDFPFIKQTLRHPVIFDGRNLYEPSVVAAQGLHYVAIGRHPYPTA